MNSNHENLKGITNSILELEKTHNLLNLQIDNVFVWQAARSLVYLSLLDALLPNNSKSAKVKRSLFVVLKRITKNILFKNPFLDFTTSEALVFQSDRKYFSEGDYFDIYTKYFCEDLKIKGVRYQKYGICNLDYKNDTAKHLDFINLLSTIRSKFIRVKFREIDIEQIEKIEEELKNIFGVSLDLVTVFEKEIIKYKSQYPIYTLLFKLKRPKQIFLISSVDKASLIKAAKDCNVSVSELQHGLISKEGLIANYPYTKKDSLAYFPNKFYIWENLNMYTSKLPLSDTNIIKFPNRHIEYLVQKYKERKKERKQILVVSQPYNSKEIFNYISSNLSELKEWKIIYKIHPVENFSVFLNSVEPLLLKFDNLTLVNNDVSVYSLFSESTYVIGNFSTTVFEAPLFGCRVLLLNLPGVEISEPLIHAGKAKLVKINEPLLNYLK